MENRLPGFLCGMYMPGYWSLSIFALHNKFPVLPLYYTLLFSICQSLERVRGLPRGFGWKLRRVSNFREAVERWRTSLHLFLFVCLSYVLQLSTDLWIWRSPTGFHLPFSFRSRGSSPWAAGPGPPERSRILPDRPTRFSAGRSALRRAKKVNPRLVIRGF